MINPLESYADAGRRAAQGQGHTPRDYGRAGHWSRWVSRAIALEAPADREAAQTAYQSAYRAYCAERHVTQPTYFR